MYKLKPLIIGDLVYKLPIIQGGMGVKISCSALVSSVCNYNAAGTLSSIALGYGTKENETNYIKASNEALANEIRLTKQETKNPFGCNILFAVNNYVELVNTAVNEKIDFIVSGAGLPLNLPSLTNHSQTKLIPIVSSAKAFEIIVRKWKKTYNKLPDAVIVEGPLAGGHLGFSLESLESKQHKNLSEITKELITLCNDFEKIYFKKIPVIAAGGIYSGKDIAEFFRLGVDGVQIASRFVVTDECKVSENFKNAYINANEEDVTFIKSPVGLPGRVIKTKLSIDVNNGIKQNFKCHYKCLKTCNPSTADFCIAKALFNAYIGDIDNSIIFAGHNVYKINKKTTVETLLSQLEEETIFHLQGINNDKRNYY